jgi:hypothetical protein
MFAVKTARRDRRDLHFVILHPIVVRMLMPSCTNEKKKERKEEKRKRKRERERGKRRESERTKG